MINYIVYTEDGQILRTGTCQSENLELQAHGGHLVVEGVASPFTDYMSDGAPVPLPPCPSPHHVFNYTAKQWVDPRSLKDLQDARWAEVKDARSAAELGGFTWDGARFDTNAVSQARIGGAAQLALLAELAGQPYSVEWTLEDNSSRTLSGSEVTSLAIALGTRVGSLFEQSQVLRAELYALTTPEQVRDWAFTFTQ